MKINKEIYIVLNPKGELVEVYVDRSDAVDCAGENNEVDEGYNVQPATVTYTELEAPICECSHCGCRYKETEQTPEDFCSVECEDADK